MRNNIVAIAASGAQSAMERDVEEGKPEREVMIGAMRAALECFLAPTEDEAFLAGVAAIIELYPAKRDSIMAEAKIIGDRSKVLNALMDGVPVDMDRVEIDEVPADAVGLIDLFDEAKAVRA